MYSWFVGLQAKKFGIDEEWNADLPTLLNDNDLIYISVHNAASIPFLSTTINSSTTTPNFNHAIKQINVSTANLMVKRLDDQNQWTKIYPDVICDTSTKCKLYLSTSQP